MRVKTRFPPENGGHIHIGHAKAAYSNFKFAKDNSGIMMIRFDDTNPKNCKHEYVTSILDDLHTLNLVDNTTEISYTSNYFDRLQEFAVQLIGSNDAYMDESSIDTIRLNRKTCIGSKSRDNSIAENMQLWKLFASKPCGKNLVL